MADPLSISASIIAVLQLSSTVLRFLVDVKNASADCKSLIREISLSVEYLVPSTRPWTMQEDLTRPGARLFDRLKIRTAF